MLHFDEKIYFIKSSKKYRRLNSVENSTARIDSSDNCVPMPIAVFHISFSSLLIDGFPRKMQTSSAVYRFSFAENSSHFLHYLVNGQLLEIYGHSKISLNRALINRERESEREREEEEWNPCWLDFPAENLAVVCSFALNFIFYSSASTSCRWFYIRQLLLLISSKRSRAMLFNRFVNTRGYLTNYSQMGVQTLLCRCGVGCRWMTICIVVWLDGSYVEVRPHCCSPTFHQRFVCLAFAYCSQIRRCLVRWT